MSFSVKTNHYKPFLSDYRIGGYRYLLNQGSPILRDVNGELTATACSIVLKTIGTVKGIGIDTLVLRTMVKIFRKEGWMLNPSDKVVNSVLKMVENNDGKCPCHNTSAETECPCSDYRLNDVCHCGLYLKVED